MCDIKITPELIIALFALVVSVMSFLHAKSSSEENHKQIEELKFGQKKYMMHIPSTLKRRRRKRKIAKEVWQKVWRSLAKR